MENKDSKVLASEVANNILNNSAESSNLNGVFSNSEIKTSESAREVKEEVDEIGVWVKGTEGFYERNVDRIDEWRHWAFVPIIEQKKVGTTRAVLLGESVARGYLFDPYFNLAKAIDAAFGSSSKQEKDFDLIDLARVSIELEELSSLTKQSFKLDPDILVVFAGNNWFNSFRKGLTDEQLKKIDRVIEDNLRYSEETGSYLDESAFSYIEDFFAEGIKHEVIQYLSLLKSLSETHDVPVIFVLPEYNVVDWKITKDEQLMCRKPLNTQISWVECKKGAVEALEHGNFQRAGDLANEVIKCDPSNPLGYYLKSRVEEKLDNKEEQYENLARARDTCVYNRSAGQARILSVVQHTLLNNCQQYGVHLINLPKMFKEELKGELPGRNLFIDYCHLNEYGLNLTAKAIADKISMLLPHLKQEAGFDGLTPEGDVKAAAYLCAAVHNAHYGQHHDILEYLCRKGLESEPVMATHFMKCFVDFSSRRSHNLLCSSHEELLEDEILNQYESGLGFVHSPNKKLMDVDLVRIMTTLLEERGVEVSEDIERVRKGNHSVTGRNVDLLESFYCKSSYDEASNGGKSYYRASNLDSKFTFIAERGSKLALDLVYRTPGRRSKDDKIEVLCNGTCVTNLGQTDTWQKTSIEINADCVNEGINNLKIRWPFKTPIKYTNFNCSKIDIHSITNKIFQVFGEIHSMKVRGFK